MKKLCQAIWNIRLSKNQIILFLAFLWIIFWHGFLFVYSLLLNKPGDIQGEMGEAKDVFILVMAFSPNLPISIIMVPFLGFANLYLVFTSCCFLGGLQMALINLIFFWRERWPLFVQMVISLLYCLWLAWIAFCLVMTMVGSIMTLVE